jgi:hypothetical protein
MKDTKRQEVATTSEQLSVGFLYEYGNNSDVLPFCTTSNNSMIFVRKVSFVFSFMAIQNESLEPALSNLVRR